MKKINILLFFLIVHVSFSQNSIFDICRTGNIQDMIAYYTKNPECVNKKTQEGYTPLILACYYGNEQAVEFLVDKVEEINVKSDYGTPLMAAVVKGNKDIVKMLLDHHADVNISDTNGTTALHYAVMLKHYDIVELLVEANADTGLKDNRNQTAKDYAMLFDDKKLKNLFK